MHPHIPLILETLRNRASDGLGARTLIGYESTGDSDVLEAVLFLKPEVTALDSGVDVSGVLRIVADKLKEWTVSIASLAVLQSEYLRRFDVISQHYGVINKISQQGVAALSSEAEIGLKERFRSELEAGAEVLGGHELLDRLPYLNAKSLDVLVGNLPVTKLAPGTYVTKVRLDGTTLLLLNGFHPYQIEHFTAPGRAIVVAAIRGQGVWREWRAGLLGATNPAEAAAGSIRRELLDRREVLRIPAIDRGNNAVHLSAGPLEGMAEVVRFCSDYSAGRAVQFTQTCFGRLLSRRGYDDETVARLARNPTLTIEGRRVSAFDATEDVQPDEALRRLEPFARHPAATAT